MTSPDLVHPRVSDCSAYTDGSGRTQSSLVQIRAERVNLAARADAGCRVDVLRPRIDGFKLALGADFWKSQKDTSPRSAARGILRHCDVQYLTYELTRRGRKAPDNRRLRRSVSTEEFYLGEGAHRLR